MARTTPDNYKALSEAESRTADTLASLGYSIQMIATVMGMAKNRIWAYQNDKGKPDTIGKKLKLSSYKNASLVALQLNSDDERNRISALNSLDTGDDDSVATVTIDTSSIKQDILDELRTS